MPIVISGKEFASFDDAVEYVKQNMPEIEDPSAYVASTEQKIPESNVRILETLDGIKKDSFSWYTHPLQKLIELTRTKPGKFLLVEGLHPMVTDPLNVGHGAVEYTEQNLMKAAISAVGKKLNLIHEVRLRPEYAHVIADGEYNEKTKTAEYFVYEEDPEILDLIRNGYITHVSMDGKGRKGPIKCDQCSSEQGCICRMIPEGITFGNEFGEAMAYVVTKKGATYNGQPIPPGPPGDYNTSVKIAETNNSMTNPITVKELATKITNPKLREMVEDDTKRNAVLKENLEQFNQALASGDAMQALQILASQVYQAPEPPIKETDEEENMKMIQEQIKPLQEQLTKIAETLQDTNSIKESMGNISTQIQEMNKVIETMKNQKPVILKETNTPTDWSKFNPKQAEAILLQMPQV